jgi:predicted O-methyltransferase YrrM
MTPEEVKNYVGNLPWMSLAQGKTITDFIHQYQIKDILELGFCHGVSTCYMAAAIRRREDGSIVTIDLEDTRRLQPNIEQLLKGVNLSDKVKVYYEPRTYIWRLMKLLEENPTPRFDLCYVDGAHLWETDGFAFFLADRLLRSGGWIIFDDLDWKLSVRPIKETTWARDMAEEERNTAQIRKVYELLVKPHPDYGEFRAELGWAYARKTGSTTCAAKPHKTEIIVKTIPVAFEMLAKHMKKS